MSEFKTRAIFGILYAALVIASVYFHAFGLLALLVLIYVAGLTEMQRLLKATDSPELFTTASIFGVLALWAHLSFTQDFQNNLLAITALLILALFVHHLFLKGSENNNVRLPKVLYSVIYLFLPTSLAITIAYTTGSWEPRYLLGLFFILWATDTFAYLTGMTIGKHKLIERLSPKKSIEGLIGGIIGALLVGYVLSLFWSILSLNQWLVFALLVAIGGTIGDLFESSIKRSAGAKDSGNLIPGHGGILDRLDSFLISVPIIYFYLRFLPNI